jgi:hypothetical protein
MYIARQRVDIITVCECWLQASEDAAEGIRDLVEHALAAMKREALKTASSHSAVHDSICEALEVLGAPYERNVLLENKLFCIQTLVGHGMSSKCDCLC